MLIWLYWLLKCQSSACSQSKVLCPSLDHSVERALYILATPTSSSEEGKVPILSSQDHDKEKKIKLYFPARYRITHGYLISYQIFMGCS